MHMHMHIHIQYIYMYIYIYIHLHTHIYIYKYMSIFIYKAQSHQFMGSWLLGGARNPLKSRLGPFRPDYPGPPGTPSGHACGLPNTPGPPLDLHRRLQDSFFDL